MITIIIINNKSFIWYFYFKIIFLYFRIIYL